MMNRKLKEDYLWEEINSSMKWGFLERNSKRL